jgi:hypothetical protein
MITVSMLASGSGTGSSAGCKKFDLNVRVLHPFPRQLLEFNRRVETVNSPDV